MQYLIALLHFFHVALAMTWFGGTLLVTRVLVPVFAGSSDENRRSIGISMEQRISKYFPPVAGATVALGLIRGLINIWGHWTTPYAFAVYASLVIGVATIVFGARVMGPSAGAVFSAPDTATRDSAVATYKGRAWFDLALFTVLIALMVAMRFGLVSNS